VGVRIANRVEAELPDQLHDHRFVSLIVTCHQNEWLHRIVGGIAHIDCARSVERPKTKAPGVQLASNGAHAAIRDGEAIPHSLPL